MSENNANDPSIKAATTAIKTPHQMVFALSQDAGEKLEKAGAQAVDRHSGLLYDIAQATGSATKSAPRLAFTESPNPAENGWLGLYKQKRFLLPDQFLKDIRVTDSLVACILRARGNVMSLYGHVRKDRFDVGIELVLLPEFYDVLDPEQFDKVTARMKRAEKLLLNCGHTAGLENHDKMTLAHFLNIQTHNGETFGRFATEVIYDRECEPDEDGNYPFHRFRPIDVGTIYRAVRKGEYIGNNLREIAMKMLESLTGEKPNIDIKRLREDHYAWIQLIEGQPRQAFTHKEMLVYNLYPSTDIEHNGYPVSPLDTVVSSVTTHMSIDSYTRLFFQNGRATRGMLVIKSDSCDESVLNGIKLQFNASLNNVANSFRTPIFGMGTDDEVEWLPFAGEGLNDAQYQQTYDSIARNILAAFNMSPDELPSYGHLAKATNSQALNESSNEYKLSAARDAGLRPLVLKFQTFFNQTLFPIIDPLLAKICVIRFAGLDAASVEQEGTRLQQAMPTYLTMDNVLLEVDKDPIGKFWGGEVLFSERLQLIHDKFKNVGELMGHQLGDNGAFVDPMLKYKRDPFWLQNLQLMATVNPNALKAYFAPRPFAFDMLKLLIQDSLEEDNE
jgi:hypothetical protein